MKILVTGAGGQLGYDVVQELVCRGHEAVGCDVLTMLNGCEASVPMDITDRQQVRSVMAQVQPDAVIHCAAWTAVDAAEDPANHEIAWAVNVKGTEYLAEVCREQDCRMMYISTDYVFSGDGTEPWDPDCGEFAPVNVYGRTKLAGEQAVRTLLKKYFIVRIAWVFGMHGGNFVKTMLKVGKGRESVRVVKDQIGTPTYTRDLARLLADMIETDKYCCYHVTNSGGYISWYDFCCEIYRQAGMDTMVLPVTTAEYGMSRAARPSNSRMYLEKLERNGFVPLPPWQDALARFLQEMDSTQ